MARLRLDFTSLLVLPALSLLAAGCARPAACQRNSDCYQAYCHDGECRKDCIDAKTDCPSGWICDETARCVDPKAVGGAGGSGGDDGNGGSGGEGGVGGQDGEGGSGGTGGAGGTGGNDGTGGSGGSGGGGVSPTTKVGFDACSSDADCTAPAICKEMYKGGPFRCTFTCTTSNDCPAGTRCETINGTSYCAQSDIGKTCTTGDDCNFACLPNQNICTSRCNDGFDCPNGYGCMEVGGQRVCAKANIYCGPDVTNRCVVPAACLSGPNAGPVMVADSCTTVCTTSADCPQRAPGLPAWSCQNGICMRPYDVYGPQSGGAQAEYVCAETYDSKITAASLCGDWLRWDFLLGQPSSGVSPFTSQYCLEDLLYGDPYSPSSPWATSYPGASNDFCADTCRYRGGCEFGFSCAAITSLASSPNARLGVCLKAGAGHVGDGCASDSDCALGYCLNGRCTRDCSADGVCPAGFTCTPTNDGTFVETGQPFRRCL